MFVLPKDQQFLFLFSYCYSHTTPQIVMLLLKAKVNG